MVTALNILLILLVLFIAYWWANQGLFSALLHLICVIVAGALALALWEPVTTGLLLRGSGFDDYAWGICLVGLFVILLFIFRVAADRFAPANIKLPRSANLAFGGILGLCAGILTMGIFVIGSGFVQSTSELMGYKGTSRSAASGRVEEADDELWVPFHKLTSDFYSLLSVTSFKPTFGEPLRHHYPDLYKQATLLRDSYRGGRGKLSLRPSDASILGFYRCGDIPNRYAVGIHFDNGARDFGEQLTLSASQLRLISDADGFEKAQTVHPHSWTQWSGYHMFDSTAHYITSEPGQQSLDVNVFFQTQPGFEPRYIQIRGTRFRLPQAVEQSCGRLAEGVIASRESLAACRDFSGAPSIAGAIEIDNDIRPIVASTNTLPGTIKYHDRSKTLTEGFATFKSGGGLLPSSKLRIRGIYEPSGTRAVKLDVSRGSPANYYDVLNQVGENPTMSLVDTSGHPYSAVGFLHKTGAETRIELRPRDPFRTPEELPLLPTTGDDTLELIFYVTEGATIQGFCFGDQPIGRASLLVTPRAD